MQTTTRLAGPGDQPDVERFLREFYAESDIALDEAAASVAIAELLTNPAVGRIWMIRCDGASVGYLAVSFGFSLEYFGRDAFVEDLYLRETYRGRGLGTRALEEVEPRCRALGIRALHLEVGRDNARAQALYRKRGFRDNDRQLLTKRLPPTSC